LYGDLTDGTTVQYKLGAMGEPNAGGLVQSLIVVSVLDGLGPLTLDTPHAHSSYTVKARSVLYHDIDKEPVGLCRPCDVWVMLAHDEAHIHGVDRLAGALDSLHRRSQLRGMPVPPVILVAQRRDSTHLRRLAAQYAIREVVYLPANNDELCVACVRAYDG
jgi:hypothetical protein